MNDMDHSGGDGGLGALLICIACLVGVLWIAVLYWPGRGGLFATPSLSSNTTPSTAAHIRRESAGGGPSTRSS
jgi:hypothetical protein